MQAIPGLQEPLTFPASRNVLGKECVELVKASALFHGALDQYPGHGSDNQGKLVLDNLQYPLIQVATTLLCFKL